MNCLEGMSYMGFNPRPREGGDHYNSGPNIWQSKVSIHAPVKGATYGSGRDWRGRVGFNPRPREGGDLIASAKSGPVVLFQSTPP